MENWKYTYYISFAMNTESGPKFGSTFVYLDEDLDAEDRVMALQAHITSETKKIDATVNVCVILAMIPFGLRGMPK